MARGRGGNAHLEPIPDDLTVMRAVAVVEAESRGLYRGLGVRAQEVARQLGVTPARRLGRGAQGPQSWSGYMAPALRISPRLLSLGKRGLLGYFYGERSVRLYFLTAAGREFIRGGEVSDEVYEMENADPIGDRPTDFEVGDLVTVGEEHEVYPNDTGVVKGIGIGTGLWKGVTVYDVLIDGTSEPDRFGEEELV